MESLRALKLIKVFGKEAERTSLWQDKYAAQVRSKLRVDQLNTIFESSKDVILGIITIIVLFFGAKAVLAGETSLGMLIAFIAYKDSFVNSSMALVEKYIDFRMLELHLSRLSDIVFEEAENKALDHHDISIVGQLSCKNLSFRYAKNEPYIFKNLNVEIDKGESIAIIGSSGVGKSTLINLLMGLTKPVSGEVLIDGKVVSNVILGMYRQNVASVSQDDTLVSGSILDNITFFEKQPDMNFVAKCAFEASILEEINAMPMQFYTHIGDMGTALSGGQKQRIILARALYRKPKILFLDEATSHLDTNNENQINLAIKSLKMTKLVVAHRKETILSCDRIFELKNGLLFDVTTDFK